MTVRVLSSSCSVEWVGEDSSTGVVTWSDSFRGRGRGRLDAYGLGHTKDRNALKYKDDGRLPLENKVLTMLNKENFFNRKDSKDPDTALSSSV